MYPKGGGGTKSISPIVHSGLCVCSPSRPGRCIPWGGGAREGVPGHLTAAALQQLAMRRLTQGSREEKVPRCVGIGPRHLGGGPRHAEPRGRHQPREDDRAGA
eukprot:scaffold4504_cov116-Isochrysis_galbana.AAC.2